MSLRDSILNASDTRLEPVPVPEWGCTVYVPILSVGDALELGKGEEGQDSFIHLAVTIIRDEQGNRIFSDADGPALARKSMSAVRKVLDVYNRINGNGEGEGSAKN